MAYWRAAKSRRHERSDDALRSLLVELERAPAGSPHLDDDGDAVALRDGLTQSSQCSLDVPGWYSARWARGAAAMHLVGGRPSGGRRAAGPTASRSLPSMDVRRVCLLGAESTGKSDPGPPRSHRAYGDESGTPSTGGRTARSEATGRTHRGRTWEFTHIARMHCWYEDFLAGYANRVLFCDTDAFTTAVFHDVYLGEAAFGDFAEEAARRYDLYLVCGLDVPWERDAIREFAEERRHDARAIPRARGRRAA